MMLNKNVLIVDGDGLLVRSHYAVGKDIVTKDSLEVGGVDKFIHVLRRQISQWNVDHVYVAFDSPDKNTWRHQKYVDYKKDRPDRPDGLVHSKNILMPILQAMGACIEINPYYEADDLVGSMAQKVSIAGMTPIVSSHDKDLLCLPTIPNTVVSPPFALKIISETDVKEKFDILPSQMLDYLALVGDAADYIPGVPLCGPQKSAYLLNKYLNLDNVITAALNGDVKNKLGENLKTYSKRTIAFRQLMELDLTSSKLNVEDLNIKDPDYVTLLKLFKDNNLMSLYNEAFEDSKK